MKVVILLGAPGSGKGTIAGRLCAADAAVRHVSSGDLLRAAVKRETAAGLEADGYMRRGELVPDALIARMIAELLAESGGGCTLVLDGFPRTLAQAAMLDEAVAGCGARLGAVVLLEMDDALLVDRIAGRRVCPACGAGYHVTGIPPREAGVCDLCGAALAIRKDDDAETVRHRLDVYRAQTVPLIGLYGERGLLRRVDGTGAIDAIAERVRQAIL